MDLFKLENTSVSGNPVVLEDCAKALLQGLTVYGKSTQVTTTGAQLFVSKRSQESIVGMTLTQKDDGGWHLEGTCTADNSRNIRLLEPTEYFTLPSGDYTLSFTGAIPNSVTLNIAKVANVHKQNEQWTHLGSINKNKRNLAISLDGTEEALSMYVIFPAQVALSFDFYVMLNAGDTALPWEPYTSGKPSPSPDYPQEIVSAGDGGNLSVIVKIPKNEQMQSVSFSTPNGIHGIPVSVNGNYTDSNGQQWICDELDFERGIYRQWIKHVNVVFNKVASSATHNGYRYVATNIQNMSKEHTECLCNIATYSKNAVNGTEGVRASGKFNTIVLYYENLTNDNVSADVVYILSNPIETPLTQSQIETYKSLRTYDGTTIIESPDSVGLSAVYGRKIYMANTTLKTRIILNNKTTDEWAQNGSFVGLKGEFLVDTVTRKIKIGDGATAYADLAYANLAPEEVQELIKNASHSHSNKSILDETTASFTTALLEKLNGIASGANKTIVDNALSSTSTNPVQNKVVNSALGGKVPTSRKVNGKALTSDITLSANDVKAIPVSQKGVANGVASLGDDGKVISAQLPSFVDDVLEGYVSDDSATFYKDSKKSSAYTAEAGKIYVDLTNNKTYRWSGSKYIVISETLALGTTASTAFPGDKGHAAYTHSQSAHAPSNAEKNIIVGIQKNGADVAPDENRKVNITVPTKTSDITNDSGFITSGATTAKAKQLETPRKIDGVGFNGTTDITHFATCATAAATQAKTVSVTGFNLVTGARVTIKFTVTNTAANPTLNVNGTGAKAIKYRGAAINTGYLAANRVYEFVYDGTDYLFMGDINTDSNTTYSAGSGLTLSGTQFKHKNAVTAGTAKGDDSKTLSFGGTFKVPSVSYDTEGHITGASSTTMTMPAAPTSVSGNAGSATKLANARNFSITGGATAAAVSFNGTADVALNVTSVNAAKLTIAESDTLILDGSI